MAVVLTLSHFSWPQPAAASLCDRMVDPAVVMLHEVDAQVKMLVRRWMCKIPLINIYIRYYCSTDNGIWHLAFGKNAKCQTPLPTTGLPSVHALHSVESVLCIDLYFVSRIG